MKDSRQGLATQGEASTKGPVHIFPFSDGAGLSQYRVLNCTPKPQLTEHGSQLNQSDHPPLTANK